MRTGAAPRHTLLIVTLFDRLHGCLLGGAIGDALGLPFERLAPQRARQIYGAQAKGLEMQLLPQRGMLSDDTEHALFTARALLESRGDAQKFGRVLRGELRAWTFYLPPGVGRATLLAGLKAWTFTHKTGVFSAGNGPAMRAPILGAFLPDIVQLREFCRVSTILTHTDPKAEIGAFAIALAAHQSAQGQCNGARLLRDLREWSDGSDAARELIDLADRAVISAAQGQTTRDFCRELGLENGVSGYIFHTVPVVLQCWLRYPHDFRAALESIIRCGGDTDSTAAILGGMIGARVGAEALPAHWRSELWDWPNSPAYIERVARELESAHSQGLAVVAPRVLLGTPFARNALFLVVILVHALRRIIPK